MSLVVIKGQVGQISRTEGHDFESGSPDPANTLLGALLSADAVSTDDHEPAIPRTDPAIGERPL
jgi:hypothetical protein